MGEVKNHDVVVLRTNYSNLKSKISEAIELCQYSPMKKKVFIKPNIVDRYSPDSGIITSPRIVESVILCLKEKYPDIQIVIGEGCGLQTELDSILTKTGYKQLADKNNIEIVDLNKVARRKIKWKYGQIEIPELVFTHEYINIAKLKTHVQTTVSLCLKNQKGLLQKKDKKMFHLTNLDDSIQSLGKVIKPDLNIIDGIIALEGDGPLDYGKIKRTDVILASMDIHAIDNVGTKLMGFNAKHIEPSTYNVIGEELDKIELNFQKPNKDYRRFNFYFHPNNACTLCQIAVKDAFEPSLKNRKVLAKLLHKGIIKRGDVIAGHCKDLPQGADCMLCVGNCSKEFAKKKRYKFVKGCPPTAKEIQEAFLE